MIVNFFPMIFGKGFAELWIKTYFVFLQATTFEFITFLIFVQFRIFWIL